MSINNIAGKKLKINLEYLGKSIGIEIEPYRTIGFLKDKTRKLFFISNSDFKIIYSNKDLTPFDTISIGEYFEKKKKLHIKVIQLSNPNYSKEINQSGTNKNEKNNILEINKNLLLGSYRELDTNSDNSIQNIKDPEIKDENINPRIESSNAYKFKTDSLKYINYKSLTKNNSVGINNKNNISINNLTIEENNKMLCECKSNLLKTYYCRNDNSFICKNCRLNETHKFHNSINVDPNNLEESIKLYAITLQANISLDTKASKDYFKTFQSMKFIDIGSRKEMIIRKLDELERMQEEALQNLPKLNDSNIQNLINDFDKKSKTANEELEEVLINLNANYYKNKKKINLENAIENFTQLNSKEKELDNLSLELNNYKIHFKINKKIDNFYKMIEKSLKDALKIENFDKNKIMNNSINNIPNTIDESFLSLDMINSMKNNLKIKDKDNLLSVNNHKLNNLSKKNKKDYESDNNLINTGDKKKKLNYKAKIKENNVSNRINIEAIDKLSEEINEKTNKEKLNNN